LLLSTLQRKQRDLHIPDLGVLDGEEHEAVGVVLLKQAGKKETLVRKAQWPKKFKILETQKLT